MVARFGRNELNATLIRYTTNEKSYWQKVKYYFARKINNMYFDRQIQNTMSMGAGFFPPTVKNLERFSDLMLESCRNIDVLGSWLEGEELLSDYLKNAKKIKLREMEPYYHENPWSEGLKHKNVLIIHPFEDSIKSQYQKKNYLFNNPDVLPDFNLITLKAVQSIAGQGQPFNDWFEAFKYMCEKVKKIDFDIAIIGCGAYGMPLASYIKTDLRKKAIHLGGATQILFGIKGKRWDEHEYIFRLYNDYWVRPLEAETPKNYKSIENGCYW